MTELFPFRFSKNGDRYLFSNDSGDFFFSKDEFLVRMVEGSLSDEDHDFLLETGFAYGAKGDFYWNSFSRRLSARRFVGPKLNYIIAVPTLRCDLQCSYCQVSRADQDARGYDWTDECTARFLKFIDQQAADPLKIEFQGGEPSLRMDIVARVVRHCRQAGRTATFVICSNLNTLPPLLLELLEDPHFTVSTSLDGLPATHRANRTENDETTSRFLSNLDFIRGRLGEDKISALPTITSLDPADVRQLIDVYVGHGFRSIYLRPVNYHGFARKTFPQSWDGADAWRKAYRAAIRYIFDRNAQGGPKIREFGLEVALAGC